jgi:adenine-specific DNA-methyltransferase
MDAEFFSSRHDHILAYAKNVATFKMNKGVTSSDELPEHYNKTDETGRPYYLKPLRAMGGDDRREDRPTLFYPLTAPNGTPVLPKRNDGSDGRWRWSEERTQVDAHLIEWVTGRAGWTPYYRIYGDLESKRPPETIWPHGEVGSNRTSKAESKALFGRDAFQTPKPERLLERVIALATKPGDIVLDSFAGSGTTGAVAHKMRRRWIMVELGEHCRTHIVPRMRKVVDGTDNGGVTEAVEWKGGGGFRYFRLAPSLLEKDAWGNWVIAKSYDPAKLSQAVCKLMGFVYQPDETHYWMQGRSSETDFIYVTTQNLTHEQLVAISEEVGDTRTLLVCCKAFRANADAFPNLTIKKIPQAVLRKCEWGKDDYSLNVANLPEAPPETEGAGEAPPQKARRKRNTGGQAAPQDDLFSNGGGK